MNQVEHNLHGVAKAAENGRFDAAIHLLEYRLRDDETIVSAALVGRLAPAALQGKNRTQIVTALHETTEARGLVALVNRPSDLLQCDTSFIMDEEGMTLLVHVPVTPRESLLEVYRFIPLPVPVHQEYHSQITLSTDILAINPENSLFRTLTYEELTRCHKVGFFFVCDKANVVRRNNDNLPAGENEEVCLLALFQQRYDLAGASCPKSLVAAPATVIQVSETRFMTYSPTEHQGTIRCPLNVTHVPLGRQTFSANSISPIDLEPGCTAYTNTHVFSAPTFDKVQEWAVEYDLEASQVRALNLTGGFDMDEFHAWVEQAAPHLRRHGSFKLNEALAEWQGQKQKRSAGLAVGAVAAVNE